MSSCKNSAKRFLSGFRSFGATCRGARIAIPIASGSRKSCCSRRALRRLSPITKSFSHTSPMWNRSLLLRRKKCCACGQGSAITAAHAIYKNPHSRSSQDMPGNFHGCAKNKLLARDSAGDWNQAMMELGATICLPRSPQCLLCPVATFCEGRKLGIAETLPEKRKKRATVAVRLISIVLLDAKNRCLVLPPPTASTKNNADDHVPSLVAKLWHFPTVSAPANSNQALEQLLHRELRIKSAKSIRPELLDKVRHTVTYRTISIAAYLIRVKQLPKISGAQNVPLMEIQSLPISNLTCKIARTTLNHLSTTKAGH